MPNQYEKSKRGLEAAQLGLISAIDSLSENEKGSKKVADTAISEARRWTEDLLSDGSIKALACVAVVALNRRPDEATAILMQVLLTAQAQLAIAYAEASESKTDHTGEVH